MARILKTTRNDDRIMARFEVHRAIMETLISQRREREEASLEAYQQVINMPTKLLVAEANEILAARAFAKKSGLSMGTGLSLCWPLKLQKNTHVKS